MNIERKEDLIEQCEDAAFALMMNNYAEQEGNRLLQEFEKAKARGEVPAVPEELYKKCRQLIHKAYQKARTKERIKQSLRVIGKSAAALFVTIGLCTILIVSVEALRTPVVNFIIEQHDKFTTINFGKEPTSPATQPTTDGSSTTSGDAPLDGILGEEYSVVYYTVRDNGTFAAYYQNESSNQVMISCTIGNSTINIDSDKEEVRTITICGHIGCLIAEKDKATIFWFNESQNYTYQIRISNGNISEVWHIAEKYILASEGE